MIMSLRGQVQKRGGGIGRSDSGCLLNRLKLKRQNKRMDRTDEGKTISGRMR